MIRLASPTNSGLGAQEVAQSSFDNSAADLSVGGLTLEDEAWQFVEGADVESEYVFT